MSDSDGKKTLGVRSGPRAGNVKQSFSHGRSKNVVVETKRKRIVVPKAGTSKTTIQTSNKEGAKNLSSGITDTEMERRLKALQAAKAREADEVAQREANAKEREQEREQKRLEQENKQRELKKAEELANEKAAEVEAAKNKQRIRPREQQLKQKPLPNQMLLNEENLVSKKVRAQDRQAHAKKIVTEMRDHLDVAAETKADDLAN